MPSANFCNSRPSSAAVVASVDSVLCCCSDSVQCRIGVHTSDPEIDRMELVQTLLQNTSHSRHQAAKLCHIDVHAGHLCRFLQSRSVKSVAGGAFPQFDISPVQLCNCVGGGTCLLLCTQCTLCHCAQFTVQLCTRAQCTAVQMHIAQCALQ